MQRQTIAARPDWQRRVEQIGFTFHSIGGGYWNESACYRFEAHEIDLLESATAELHAMCLEAVDHIVRKGDYGRLAIPDWCCSHIEEAWQRRAPGLYGRFDLSYTGEGPPKLLEYNADTPTSIYEAAVVQWFWLKDVKPEHDQFNAIHEKLIERWRLLLGESADKTLHLSSVGGHEEDFLTVEYLRDTAMQADLDTRYLAMEEIGWSADEQQFVDMSDRAIQHWFKLYPWEWLVREPFGRHIPDSGVQVIEPWWKMLLSNKGVLAILWELFPNHPYLLPCHFNAEPLGDSYVRKPLLGREGANIEIVTAQTRSQSPGQYGDEGFVYQAPAMLPCFDGNHAVIGAWVIGDEPAGIGIREDDTAITRDTSRFVPHYF